MNTRSIILIGGISLLAMACSKSDMPGPMAHKPAESEDQTKKTPIHDLPIFERRFGDTLRTKPIYDDPPVINKIPDVKF